ncbi:pyocin knob domain-containing S74 family peptidase [Rahnella aceris]|uniref:pyocin knob domain-containing S74 family peptidase n=1 Tax=Rahnella sp. (strain Y9602) TaxID=2703885 RepID=UPI001C27203F|nr:pyocin knob domain-containing S74 family peptidase [Rahnella aceris]MBU9849585.1 tail fiber domain-containing protein [Rahnella aceris]
MAWYKTGTVAVAATKVTGTGTNFLDAKFGIGPGQAFLLPASGTVKIYEIASVEDATHLTLTTSAGTVAAGAAYAVMSFYTDSVPDFSKRLAAQLGYYQSQMDGWQQIMTGTGTIAIVAPDNTVVNISSFSKLTSDIAKAYADGGNLGSTIFPNNLGNTADFNIYYQTANANAIIANGYPIGKAGTLFVTKSAYGCQQMYITFQGEAFVRGLTGNFNSAAPNWSDWWPIFTGKSIIPVANGGTGAATVAAAPFAPKVSPAFSGNGSISGNFTVGAQVSAGPAGFYTQGLNNPAIQGAYMGWNGTGIVGGADFVCNRGQGSGGFRFRVVNSNNTAVITDFTMLDTGQGTSSAGWTAVSDIDVKMHVEEIDPEEALTALTSWRTCSWDYCSVPSEYDEAGKVISVTKGAKGFGFIAQDVQKDCPDAVTLTQNPQLYIDEEGELFAKEDTLSLNTLGISAAYSGAAIKALKKRNEDQAELIAALSERLKTIETTLGINNEPAP